MRNARKLVLLALAAMTALAFTASAASAQGITIKNENTGVNCPSVEISGTNVTGGCLLHATSEGSPATPKVELRKHVFGIESHITVCNNEFHGRVNSAGAGYLLEQHLTGANCTRQACAETAERGGTPWGDYDITTAKPPAPATGLETDSTAEGDNSEELIIRFCVEPNGGGTDEDCRIEVPFETTDGANHVTEFGHATEIPGLGTGGFRCELVGHWITELGDSHDSDNEVDVEVTHN